MNSAMPRQISHPDPAPVLMDYPWPAIPRRRRLVVGNWKMHGSLALCRESVPALAAVASPAVGIVLCPPAPYLGEMARLAQGTRVEFSGQDVGELACGPRTGEWSAAMLGEIGCKFALVGHSERRQHHYENDALIAGKARACAAAGITPIVCIGESQDEHEKGETARVLRNQLDWLLTTPHWRDAIIAYEPLWAIGSNRPATPELAQATHAFIRDYLAQSDAAAAASMPLLYGGSVKADNAAALFGMPDIDGVLVGGASLDVTGFLQIYTAALVERHRPRHYR
ncbi:triose-phosphate isomerase [Chitinilyticum aquatile]|uniref:triose-phosphate isomerase n=1 Tax=Chitinilyticum aquatile TaxID=362520 RepID=UPI000403E3AF|nr:triose-phosphate isomerase [Chitinilyticum aquatile]